MKVKLTLEQLNTVAEIMPNLTVLDLIEMINRQQKRA